MQNSMSSGGNLTIGLDLGDRYTHYHILDEAGETLERGRLKTTSEAFRERFAVLKPSRVALETGTHSPWVSRLLSELHHEVLVANPRQLPLIYENTKKSDEEDPELLARLARLDPKLLKPIEHRPKEMHADLATLQSRGVLVEARTKLINHVRGSVKPFGSKIRSCSSPSFHRVAAEAIPPELQDALLPILEMIEQLTDQIRAYERAIEKEINVKHPATASLQQVSGVGPILSLAFILMVVNPKRFKTSRAVGAYVGLAPRRDESGEQQPQLRITKAGNPLLRRLLVSGAQYILGPFGPDTDLKRFGKAMMRRGGKNAKKRAVVAVARKLAVLLHRLWLTGEVYEPLRNAQGRRREPRE